MEAGTGGSQRTGGPDAGGAQDRFAEEEFQGVRLGPNRRQTALEELLLTGSPTRNRAIGELHELVDDRASSRRPAIATRFDPVSEDIRGRTADDEGGNLRA